MEKNNENKNKLEQIFEIKSSRRDAIKSMISLTALASGALNSCTSNDHESQLTNLKWEEYFQKNYKLMTDEEKKETVHRFEKKFQLEHNQNIRVSSQDANENVLFGYAFNISKCQGYGHCIEACIEENNQDRKSEMQYIRIHEIENGAGINFEEADDNFSHQVPAEGVFYMGTQCFHCDNPPCVEVCPVKATWKEKDGIVVIDYNWCIGCRYCMSACPYDGRRFNWAKPEIPENEINKDQHYLGNRLRMKGVMEKCTFCIQRTRKGLNTACVEACPTGARVFGNLLDPHSDIRKILDTKKVFRLKEDLGTEPKFWYYMD